MITIYSHSCGAPDSIDQYLPEGKDWSSTGAYLHGELERLIGYDIAYVPIDKLDYPKSGNVPVELRVKRYNLIVSELPMGINDVVVKANGTEYKAKAFIYRDTFHTPENGGRLRGLIVLENDKESVAYAKQCFSEKKAHL